MRITVTIDGTEHECTVPYPGAQYVGVGGCACPHCAAWPGLVQDGVTVALARTTGGLAQARMAFPRAVVVDPAPQAPLHVRMPSYATQHDRYTGAAECCRCSLAVGTMQVVVSTLFGLEEDQRVLEGRHRVY